MTHRKLFLQVDDAAAVANDVERSLFVPTRLTFALGEELTLGLRLSQSKRALELPVVVIGRRVPRAGSLLSAGVLVRMSDLRHPLVDVVRELAAGRVVDLEARIQERVRLPAKVSFATREEAVAELAGLVDEEGAALAVNAPFARGDRLSLDVEVAGGSCFSCAVLVKRSAVHEGKSSVVATALDDNARAAVVAWLADPAASRRA